MFAPRSKLILLSLAALAAMLVSVVVMARRVDEYYRTSDHKLYIFKPVQDRRFSFAGRPVEIADDPAQEGVQVRYGDQTLRLAATVTPGSPQLPGLIRHRDWMQVLRFAEHGRISLEEVEAQVKTGKLADRLAVVVRTPPPEAERAKSGHIFRKEWAFDLYEFKPDGQISHERLGFPKRRKAEPGELVEGTWQFYAALTVMPRLGRPSPRFIGDALPAMGWTLPAAAFSGLILTFSGAALLAPRSRR